MGNPPVTRATVLISGEGSNLQAIIDATDSILSHLKIVRVISNRAKVNGIKRAHAAGIPTAYHNLISGKYQAAGEKNKDVRDAARYKYDQDLSRLILADNPHIVICAGFMHVLTPIFLESMKEREIPVINLHPALHGRYDGTNAIQRAFDDFQAGKLANNKTGVMIHYVIGEVDRGEVIIQREVECQIEETLHEFENRMHSIEHQLIVEGTVLAIEKIWNRKNELEIS
ncbi:Bgt-1092 [Blumeria graminis f. sp. tritici]|uniref:Phosphoribosylglycinamide formyltransferase n=2 Tax=Blumeria graminis f. sp. tritici TaxID=62690 RepID=A0A9X9QED9_BLUGR|nr:Phosphoribosyl-glycinamide transformylase [Blumeria graminis f. sp. tritici 96224]VDB90620.1 Bgt-1092 [Blumeria graminis f. sp. tritici]